MAKVLIVDDNSFDRLLLQNMVERFGHSVFHATDGSEVSSKITQYNPDIILLDLYMPKKEGIETLMDNRDVFSDLPVIIVSNAEMDYLDMAIDLGARCSFKKPPDPEQLNEKILEFTTSSSNRL